LDLNNAAAVATAAEAVLQIAAQLQLAEPAVVVQESISGSTELILGMSQDPSFGPVTVVGMGGVFTEIFSDAQTRPAPISAREAEQMLDQLKGAPLLQGARGRPVVDKQALA